MPIMPTIYQWDEHIGSKENSTKVESSQSKTHEVSTYDFTICMKKISYVRMMRVNLVSDAYDAITSYDYAMYLPDIQDGEKAILRFSVASRSSAYPQFTFTINSTAISINIASS